MPADELGLFAEVERRDGVLRGLREAGFAYVTVDLAGLQSGAFTLQVLRRG